MGVGGQRYASAALPGTYCIGGLVGPRAGLDRCGKYRPTGIRSPDRPAHSDSLYRLRYPGPFYGYSTKKIWHGVWSRATINNVYLHMIL
jgi:hypothetical protein